MTARALTPEEEGRYRTILAGRGRDWNKRDWTSLDIAALLATLDASRAEATAAAEQRLRSKVLALPAQPYTLSGLDTTTDSRMVNRAAVLALLDTPSPASPRQGEPQAALASDPASPSEPAIPLHQGAASPRQGEPVDGLRDVVAAKLADAEMESYSRYLVPGLKAALDAMDLRAALSEPAEAGEP